MMKTKMKKTTMIRMMVATSQVYSPLSFGPTLSIIKLCPCLLKRWSRRTFWGSNGELVRMLIWQCHCCWWWCCVLACWNAGPGEPFLGSDEDQVDGGSVVVDDVVGEGGIVVDDYDDSLNSPHLDVSSKDDPASLELTGIIFQLWNERATRWKG